MISLIIPAYNSARFLPACLESALSQDVPDTEIIVVNDGSTDDTEEILRRYAGRIRVLLLTNVGLAAARNAGLATASGNSILFLDADDVLGPGVLAAQQRLLAQTPDAGAAVCRNRLFRVKPHGAPPVPFDEWRLFRRDLHTHLCHFNIAPVHAVLIRRSWVQKAGQFDSALTACEDHDFWLRCALAGCQFAVNPEGLVYYRRHTDGMSADVHRQNLADAVMHLRIARLLNLHPDFPTGRRGCAWLANAAGSCLTAARLAECNECRPDLLRNAESSLKNAANTGEPMQDALSRMFIARILHACRLPRLAGLTDAICGLINEIARPRVGADDPWFHMREYLRLEGSLY